ncbi:MAG TPA: hypothetical protein VMM92_02880 [Thermoanaerobaculia bacterium]|nr:hypothetical protein [Thermoanaerobaculia bacterium]
MTRLLDRTGILSVLSILSLASFALPLTAQRAAPAEASGVVDASDTPRAHPLLALASASSPPLALLGRSATAAPGRLAEIAAWNRDVRQPVRNGFTRDLPVTAVVDLSALATARPGTTLAGGIVSSGAAGEQVWSGQVRVLGAFRLRLHLASVHLPEGSRLWVYGENGNSDNASDNASGSAVGPFGPERLGPAGDLWTPSVGGAAITLEVHLPLAPPGRPEAGAASFALDRVLELFDLDSTGAPLLAPRAVPACLVDATCIADSRFHGIDNVRRAIALLGHLDSSGTFADQCTGALVNDTDDTTTLPYLLTANHCLSTPSSAASLEVFFDAQTASCNGAAPDLDHLPRVNGSTLLATSGDSDFTLLKLAAFPDNRRYLLGWDARTSVLTDGTLVHQISHPFALPQSYNEATFEVHPRHFCSPSDEGGIPINDLTKFIYLHPTYGGTFVGSSGSPVMLDGGLIVGQLTDGCGPNPQNGCDYRNDCANGAFSATYPKVAHWLDPGSASGGTPSCVSDDQSLCLQGGRFRVRAQWTTGDGQTGPGHALPLTGDTGYFWFFAATNVEVVTKVLNGCGLGSHYWFFAGGLTDVRVVLTVTDTLTAAVRQYTNPQGKAFQPIQDTSAFETCP